MPDEDWLFVSAETADGPKIVLYDTREEAEEQAKIWNGKGVVVEYTTLD